MTFIITHNIAQQARLRRLDALFAEKVLGFRVIGECEVWHQSSDAIGTSVLRSYTRSLDAAWEGVEKLGMVALMHSDNPANPKYVVRASTAKRHHEIPVPPFTVGEGRSDNAAEAVVLACLRAVGVPESDLA